MSKHTAAPVDPITLAVVRRAGDGAARDDADAGEDRPLQRLQPGARLQQRAVRPSPGNDPAGPGHPDSSGFADPGHEGGRRFLWRRPARRRHHLSQRPGLPGQPHPGLLHVQAGVPRGRAGVLDGLQGPPDRYRRPGARRVQPGCARPVRRRAADPAGQALGPRRAARRRDQPAAVQYAGAARPGRRPERAIRRLPRRRAPPARAAGQVRAGHRAGRHRRAEGHGRPPHALADRVDPGRHVPRPRAAGGRRPRPWRHDHLGGGDGQRRQRASASTARRRCRTSSIPTRAIRCRASTWG